MTSSSPPWYTPWNILTPGHLTPEYIFKNVHSCIFRNSLHLEKTEMSIIAQWINYNVFIQITLYKKEIKTSTVMCNGLNVLRSIWLREKAMPGRICKQPGDHVTLQLTSSEPSVPDTPSHPSAVDTRPHSIYSKVHFCFVSHCSPHPCFLYPSPTGSPAGCRTHQARSHLRDFVFLLCRTLSPRGQGLTPALPQTLTRTLLSQWGFPGHHTPSFLALLLLSIYHYT